MTFREFGFEWEVRQGDLGAGSPWDGGGITRWTAPAVPHMPSRRRLGLNCTNLSAGVKLVTPLGFGEVLVYGEGCLDALPLGCVAAVWVYDDRPELPFPERGGDEGDFERFLTDENQASSVWLGVHRTQDHLSPQERSARGDLVKVHALSSYHWRVRIRTSPTQMRIGYEAWQPSSGQWKEGGAGLFVATRTEFSTLRLGCWRSGPMMTKSRAPAKFAIAGVGFTPMQIT